MGVSPAPLLSSCPVWEIVNADQKTGTVARCRKQGKNKSNAEQEVLMNRKHEARDV